VRAAILQAFDLLICDRCRWAKMRLARLLARVSHGIEFNAHTDEDGATVFRHACAMGMEYRSD
jgi:hypothetical protein